MKNFVKGLLTALIGVTIGMMGVEAETATKSIDTSVCETVYTNYYFFLEANTANYLESLDFATSTHSNRAEYYNNFYSTEFDSSNIGYGQVKLNRSTTTSSNGLKSMSMEDYYKIYLKAVNNGGTYSKGNKNYIVGHGFYRVNNNTWEKGGSGLNLASYTKSSLMDATINANSTISLVSDVDYDRENPFLIEITRTYTGTLTGTPITYGENKWYLHPAVYYIQYCEESEEEHIIRYHANSNGDAVTDLPGDKTFTKNCTTISKSQPKRDGYTFLGWSTNKSASVAMQQYNPGSEYCDGDIDLYAIWVKNSNENSVYNYTVTYNQNTSDDVSNMPSNVTMNSNEDVIISSLTPVRNGYTFLGWSTDANSTNRDENYIGGTVYTARKDLVLYAIWKKNAVELPSNPQTGVMDYLVPFGGVAVSSGALLGILRKKKSFRQF